MFICGFDVRLPNRPAWEAMCADWCRVAGELGLRFVAVATNLRSHRELGRMRWARYHGAVLAAATHLLEAIVLEECGMDFIVAQGAEAGGHRSAFVGHPEQGLVGTITLTPLLARHVAVPIIAAGGVMDGSGIAAAQMLGAVGVQMGTAFLACPESGATVLNDLREIGPTFFFAPPRTGISEALEKAKLFLS